MPSHTVHNLGGTLTGDVVSASAALRHARRPVVGRRLLECFFPLEGRAMLIKLKCRLLAVLIREKCRLFLAILTIKVFWHNR